MKAEWRLFGVLALFVFAMSGLYAWWTDNASPEQEGGALDPDGLTYGVEWIGTLGLIMSGLLLTMVASAMWLISRRIERRPEDRPEAEIAEGAGDLGFFSPGSYWPFGIALAAAVAAVAMPFQQWWLVGAGLVAVIVSTCGLTFEYYTGTRRAEH